MLNVKLQHLDRWNELRREHAARYRELLAPHADAGSLTLQSEMSYAESVYHLFVIQADARDSLQRFLSAAGVQTGIHYPVPVHLQPAYASLGHKEGDFPVAESQARRAALAPDVRGADREAGQLRRAGRRRLLRRSLGRARLSL